MKFTKEVHSASRLIDGIEYPFDCDSQMWEYLQIINMQKKQTRTSNIIIFKLWWSSLCTIGTLSVLVNSLWWNGKIFSKNGTEKWTFYRIFMSRFYLKIWLTVVSILFFFLQLTYFKTIGKNGLIYRLSTHFLFISKSMFEIFR